MAEDRVQRKLAAILAADVVGYSRLMGTDEAGTRARFNDNVSFMSEFSWSSMAFSAGMCLHAWLFLWASLMLLLRTFIGVFHFVRWYSGIAHI